MDEHLSRKNIRASDEDVGFIWLESKGNARDVSARSRVIRILLLAIGK